MEEQLIKLLLTAESNDNSKLPTQCVLKRRIVEGKVAIDRWNFTTDNYITHPDNINLITNSFEPLVEETLKFEEKTNVEEPSSKLWGAELRFNKHCPKDKIICFCSSGLVENFNKATCIIDISDLVN